MTRGLEIVRREEPRPGRLLRLLDGLQEPDTGLTLVLAAGDRADAALSEGDPAGLSETLGLLLGATGRAEAGLVLFWGPAQAYAVRPPLPPPLSARLEGWQPAALLDILGRQYWLAVLLLRHGGYVVGIFQGDVLVASKTGTRFVKNRHRKGGQSQRRFDRIREKQIDELFGQACQVARERIAPYADRLDGLFMGGDRHTVQAFLKECSYLRDLPVRLQGRFLNTPEPRQDTLTLACDLIWRSEWIELGVRNGGQGIDDEGIEEEGEQ